MTLMFLCKEDRKKPTIILPLGRIALRCHCNGKQAAAAHFDQVHCQIRMPRKGQWFSAGVWNWGPGLLGQPGSVTFLKWNWATFNDMQLWTDGWNNQTGSQARKKNPLQTRSRFLPELNHMGECGGACPFVGSTQDPQGHSSVLSCCV